MSEYIYCITVRISLTGTCKTGWVYTLNNCVLFLDIVFIILLLDVCVLLLQTVTHLEQVLPQVKESTAG